MRPTMSAGFIARSKPMGGSRHRPSGLRVQISRPRTRDTPPAGGTLTPSPHLLAKRAVSCLSAPSLDSQSSAGPRSGGTGAGEALRPQCRGPAFSSDDGSNAPTCGAAEGARREVHDPDPLEPAALGVA